MKKGIFKTLFDQAENRPLVLKNDAGTTLGFEQIYATERDDGVYCILRPLAVIVDATPQTAFVFEVTRDCVFKAVKNKSISDKIFAEYYEAIERLNRK